MNNKEQGFTLIEILVVIGMIAILATIVIIAINPARQFAQGRNTQRTSNVTAILNAIGQNIADNKGLFSCSGAAYSISTSATDIKNGGSGSDLAPCLVPTYISSLPFDPTNGAYYTDDTHYDTGYTVMKDATTGRITVAAPNAAAASELSQTITLTR